MRGTNNDDNVLRNFRSRPFVKACFETGMVASQARPVRGKLAPPMRIDYSELLK